MTGQVMNRHAVLSMVAHSPTSIFKIRKFHKFRDGEVIPTHTRHLTHVAIFSHPSLLVLPGAKKIKHSINTPPVPLRKATSEYATLCFCSLARSGVLFPCTDKQISVLLYSN